MLDRCHPEPSTRDIIRQAHELIDTSRKLRLEVRAACERAHDVVADARRVCDRVRIFTAYARVSAGELTARSRLHS